MIGRRRTAKTAGDAVQSVIVRVAEPPHLCRVQAATRELCRSSGLDEGDVFSAVIAVTELAHRHFIEGARTGGVELSIIRRRNGRSLEVRTKNAGPDAPASACLNFPSVLGVHQ